MTSNFVIRWEFYNFPLRHIVLEICFKNSLKFQDELLLSPVSKASRSDSRASFGSIHDPMIKGSTESLFDFRRQSSSGVLDTLSMDEMAELSLAGSVSSPCVPTVVMMCIRHLEQFGLHTVGIFRVSSSKKRVKQVIKSIQSLHMSVRPLKKVLD